jgi:DNA polymerase I-like protein with 3'-5' exonuclease and polymerase domains
VPKVGANLIYDLGFLAAAGVTVRGPLYDVQLAEPLIDETRPSYSLEALAQHHLGEGKLDDELGPWICSNLKDGAGRKFNSKNWKGAIWQAPAEIVGPYAVSDIDLPLRIFARQKAELERLDLWGLFEMEISLLPMLLAMRQRGVAVDILGAETLYQDMSRRQDALYGLIRDASGVEFRPWNSKDLGRVFDALEIPYELTSITKAPSITTAFLEHHPHEMARNLRALRYLDKLKEVFIRGAIIEASFNQLRSDSYGTVSGRFSSSNPNLQQIPARGEDGKAIRSLFVPDDGMLWACFDWNQIEYRLIVNDAAHFGFRGAAEIVEKFNTDPKADYHQVVADMTGLPRDQAKTINFGIAYGKGSASLSVDLGLDLAAGELLLREYHRRAPFMRPLIEYWMNVAHRKRQLRTALGRIRRFNKYELLRAGKRIPLKQKVPGARLVTFTALNARIQGSAADVMKYAMADIWRSGVCAVLGAPHLTIHDELNFSAPDTTAGHEALAEVKNIMENVVNLAVTLTVAFKTGKNWGVCK